MKFAQFVIGPAGCGKSTYCFYLQQHCDCLKRTVHVINLDPAAEHFRYAITADVRDLIELDDAMSELDLGPNGGLMFCMEFLEKNLTEWLAEELDGFGEDDYVLFDCPGQLELYSHVDTFKRIIDYMHNDGWQVCAVYCLDCQFLTDVAKFVSGSLAALAAMVHLELPHVNLLTKMDLCPVKDRLEEFLYPQAGALMDALGQEMAPRFAPMNAAIAQLVDNYNLVSFVPFDILDETSIADALL